jgi:ribulose 1,5-bisphosphate synthetase/thiazole synthase
MRTPSESTLRATLIIRIDSKLESAMASASVNSRPFPFRVIISGGSVSGLTLALVLEKAGIDYLLLERREIAPQVGAGIGMHAHGGRISKCYSPLVRELSD